MDDDDRVAQLTEHQRACLELLLQHCQIKEIAQRLGVSVSTVNQRLERARRVLGAANSWAAARMMAESDRRRGIWIPPTGYENTLPDQSDPQPDEPAFIAKGASDDRLADIGYGRNPATGLISGGLVIRWPFPTAGRPDNDLNAPSRIAWVLPIAILFLGLLMIIALLSLGVQDVLAGLQHALTRLT